MNVIATIDTDHQEVWEVDFNYDNTRIITCGKDKYGRVWSTADWSRLFNLNVYHEALSCNFGDNG